MKGVTVVLIGVSIVTVHNLNQNGSTRKQRKLRGNTYRTGFTSKNTFDYFVANFTGEEGLDNDGTKLAAQQNL